MPWMPFKLCLMACVAMDSVDASEAPCTALEAARRLVAPKMTKKKHGEFEGGDFWEEHDVLLKQAWQERVPLQPSLYRYDSAFEEKYLHPSLRRAAEKAREGQEEEAFALFEDGGTEGRSRTESESGRVWDWVGVLASVSK